MAQTTRLEDRPDTRSAASDGQTADLVVCRDIAAGTRHVRNRSTVYLPQHPGEEAQDYSIRLKRSILFNAFERTVNGLSGMVFKQDPVVGEDVPDEIVGHIEDIDYRGTHLDVFAKVLFSDAMAAGHAGLFVDAPVVAAGVERPLSLLEERQAGVRPYWVHILKEDIVSWRTVLVGGRTILAQLVLRERKMEDVGLFGEAERTDYRVYRLVAAENGTTAVVWELWNEPEKGKVPVLQEEGTIENQEAIPFVPIYGNKPEGFLVTKPPLVDLAHINVAHYQTLSDHLHALHIGSVPVLYISGMDPDDDIVIGPNMALKLADPNAKAAYIEHGGSALNATRQQLLDFEKQMAVLGLGMLQHETRAAETAEAKRIDKSEQDSALATAARSLQDGLEQALKFHARYLKKDDGGSIAVSRDFDTLTLSAQEIESYGNMVDTGKLSLETMWMILQEGGRLPDDFDVDEEKARLEVGNLPDAGGGFDAE